MKPIDMATPSAPSCNQNALVSDGSTSSWAPSGSVSAVDAVPRDRVDNAFICSSADGPEAANPGSFPAHPIQNIAVARLLPPQRSQTVDMVVALSALPLLHRGLSVYIGAFLLRVLAPNAYGNGWAFMEGRQCRAAGGVPWPAPLHAGRATRAQTTCNSSN
ncbi:hypothetical protein QTH97_32135 [Variovorax sp. J22R24]|nr:hypothetical protein [Variovorax sp. J22R24]